MKRLPIYLSLILLLTCAKEDNTSLIEGYQLQISQLNSKITEYSNQVTQLQSTVNSLNSQVNTIPGLEDTITSLNEQIAGLEDTIAALTSEVSVIPDLNDEILSLEETIASLNEQIEELEILVDIKNSQKPFEHLEKPNYLDPSHYTRIPYLHTNYEDMYNTYGTGLVKDNYVGPPRDAVVIDYNGDGYYDLVHSGSDWEKAFQANITDDDYLGNHYREKIQFFYGNEKGELTLDVTMSSKFWGLLHGYKGNVNDYNNDGIPDILFAGTGWHGNGDYSGDPTYLNHEYPTMLLSKGIGEYEQINFYDLKRNYDHSVSSGDYDNDGDVDVIFISAGLRPEWVEEYEQMESGYILKNNGGEFEIVPLGSVIPSHNLMFNKFSSELVDINNDGFLDLLLGGDKMVDSHILLGDGVDFKNGVIEIPGVPNYDFGMDFSVYDYDKDGDKDIILNRIPDRDSGSHYEGWYIQVLKNEGGSFIDVSSTDITDNSFMGGTYWINFIHIVDFDNDGIVELFNNTIDRNSDYTPCPTCNKPKLEWELIDGKFIKK